MKHIIFALVSALLMTSPANAQLWGAIKNSGMPSKTPDAAYQVEAAGVNFRVYEWTPETDPDTVCIAMFSESGTSMQCMAKETAKTQEGN